MASLLFVLGTRPEAIKLCPVVREALGHAGIRARICVTAQHREMLDQVLDAFSIQADWDLNVMASGQTLCESTARILSGLQPVLTAAKPDLVIVQGDTTTTFAGALAAFYNRIPVAHVEAGLRTGDMQKPFPEEANRVLAGRIAELHFAATERARLNLEAEGVPASRVSVTGNTGIDALLHVVRSLEAGTVRDLEWPQIDDSKKLIVVTAHRRESFGAGFKDICEALSILGRRPDVQIVYPVHPNPNVRDAVERLRNEPNVVLLQPLDYVPFVALMRRAYLLLTDSGGIQEEAPSLGKPVLVLREKTERPEAVEAGTARLVGTNQAAIVATVTELLDDPTAYASMVHSSHNPYGDGKASERIVSTIYEFLNSR